jgi:hypothetical protein
MYEFIKDVYPDPLKRLAALALFVAVNFENGIRHIPDTVTPETTEEEFAQYQKEGFQRFGRLSVKFHLNNPDYDQRLVSVGDV